MTIKKLNLQSDISLCQHIVNELANNVGWGNTHQIGLRSKLNSTDKWFDSVGSLYDKTTKIQKDHETDFNIWNVNSDNYLRQEIEKLQEIEKFTIGRVRIMKLFPQRGLSVHKDNEVRYHLVLKTNPKSYFAFTDSTSILPTDVTEVGKFYHIPADGFWYFVDTTKFHWVYNGGNEERIHIVVCGLK